MKIDLLNNASATGAWRIWPGGAGTFSLAGTIGGATVTLQMLGPDGSTAISLGTDAALTAAGLVNFELPACSIRAAVSGGSPSGLYATAVGF